MPLTLKTPLKDDDEGKGKGRRYNPELANVPGGIRAEEISWGLQLAVVSITDNEEGTLANIGQKNPWHIHAMSLITGSVHDAHRPLSEILSEHLGLELDRAFSHTKITAGGHPVDTQGYIAHNETDVVLAYRCTIGGFDWLTNLSTTTSEFEPEEDAEQGHSGFLSCLSGRCTGEKPRIHTGFYNGFLVSQPDVLELVEPYIKGSATRKRFFIVGHSLGAGIATSAFAYLLLKYNWDQYPHKLILVTAGGPRVCDDRLAQQLNKKMAELRPSDKVASARIVRDEDVVPTVPMALLGFHHLRNLVHVDKHGDIIINPETARGGSGEDDGEQKQLEFSDFVEDAKDLADAAFDIDNYKNLLNKIPGPFVDHMPDMYLDPLMALMAKHNQLNVRIISATGLRNADWLGVSDPYCICSIRGKDWSCRTPAERGTLDPEWKFFSPVVGYEEGDVLEFTIWDENTARRDVVLGRASIESKKFHKYGWKGDLLLTDTGHDKVANLKVKISRF